MKVSEGGGNVGGGIEPTPTDRTSQEALTAGKSQSEMDAERTGAAEVKEETFYEEGKVPDGLKPSFREMQKAFTQKTQGIADVKKQAEAFQMLMDNPNFQTWAQRNFLGGSGVENPAVTRELPEAETGEFVSEEEKQLKDISTRQDQLEEELAVSKNEQVLDKLAAKYPDFDQFLPKMWPLVQDGTPYEAAYFQAKYGGDQAETKKQVRAEIQREMEAERKAQVEGVGPSSGMLVKEGAKTIQEAYESAKEGYKP